MKLKTLCLLACAATSAGCATAPVLKVEDFGDNRIAYYTAEGGVVMKGRDKGICVMPPAQGVREVSSKGSLKLDAKTAENLSASIDTSGQQDHATQSLFTRSQGDLYLETMMYRLCEMNANGFFDASDNSRNIYRELVLESMKQAALIIKAETALEKQRTATAVAAATADTARAAAAAAAPASTPEEKKSAEAKVKLLQDNLDTLRPLVAPQPLTP